MLISSASLLKDRFFLFLYFFIVDLETSLEELTSFAFACIPRLQVREHLVGSGKAGIDAK